MKKNKKAISTRTGQLIVTLVWLAACVLGALFYLISGTFDNFIDAFFESSSGFTTTGATVITDLSSVPGYVLLIRSLTHWLGGMGIVVLFAAIIPSWGIRGQLAAYSETPGPDKGKFTAKFADTAKELYLIYMILSAVLILLLKISDMSWLDSITTAFSTIATGGFTNYNDNASGFSVQVKIILIVFMYIAGVNFNLYYRFRRQGIKVFLKDQELRFYTIVMAVGALLIFAVNCWFRTGESIGYNLLDSFFHVVSVNTTTGFTFGNYDNWPTTSRMILFCFFFIGGCASSTAGGIKVSRILICLKLIKRSFSMRIHPYRVSKIIINEHEISSDIAIKATGFDGILLIVANPVDVLTHVAYVESGLPKERVIGSGTVLDTARFKHLLSRSLKVDARNVHGIIIGEHGDSELPVWSITNIGGMPFSEFCSVRGVKGKEKLMEQIHEEVRDSAYRIIEKKGATYYGVATAIARICEVIVKNEHTMLPVSTELTGEYGFSGLSLSVPSIVGAKGVETVLELSLNHEERTQLSSSANTLKEIIATL